MRIREWLPNAIVYPSDDYSNFLRNLNRCDIQLASFPVGGTNSNVDALRLGIPVVTLWGEEVHSRVDGAMLKAIDVPSWLIAKSEAGYVDAAIRLIENDQERFEISSELLSADLEGQFFDSNFRTQPKDFVEMVSWLYDNHEIIQRDGRKVWSPAERGSVVTERTPVGVD